MLAFEYMFFREPEKCSEQCIPLENFIHDHDGTTHVSVENEHTIFYFDIKENNLFLALHKFGLFFVNPIMPKHIFMEQLKAINTEFQISLFNGRSKYEQLFSSFAQTGHPANMFSVEYLIKLRINIDYDKLFNALDRFKKRHYSAHRMKLAIRSGLSLDTMEKFVKECFVHVPNNRMPPNNLFKFKKDLPFDTSAFRKMYKVNDDTEHLTRLQITWALPSFSDFYKYDSYQYIPWIIGYKGKGSLISYLRQKMWSPTSDNNMFCCEIQQNSLYSLIQLTIPLTSKGQKHLEDVLDAIFSFIKLLKTEGPREEIYNNIFKIKQHIFSEVLMDMYCRLLEQLLAEELYPALQVGFKYDISVNRNGFTLKIRGLNETLPLLAASFAHGMVQYSSLITKDIFENTKIQQIQTYYDSISKPDIFIVDMALSILKSVHHSLIDMHTALQDITLKDFQDFVKSFTECLYIQCLVQGNITSTAAIETLQQFIKIINCRPLHSNTTQQFKGTQIPLGISYYKIKNINKLDTISMMSNYYQIGVTTIELLTLINLISYIMTDKLHKRLRTDKFIYITIDVRDDDGILGYSITVCIQASKYTTEYIDKEIDEFLRWFKNDLEKLTEKELDDYKEIFLKSRLHDNANLEDEVERNWEVIVKCTYIFDFHEQEILALKKINVNKLREWLADYISNESNFRKLSLHIVGSIPKKTKYVHLEYINDDNQQYKTNKNHYITKVGDYKKKLFMFPTNVRTNFSSEHVVCNTLTI
ncbi:Nardilysin [Acromyrmex echinatior]|uniref:Nardilysin n=1 Tax=Acromyrmex echinatior TaxID=103372 RepID=F4X5H6_ACREC|nr:Nardilysin [Acromyrmex echinatior]